MTVKNKKNLIRSPDEYSRYYGNFRGVDFSSDHTEVHDQRLAYAINMYKDYRTGEGNAIETVPGYRRRFVAPRQISADGSVTFDKIHGIHEIPYIIAAGGRNSDILVHAGKYLYLWNNYPASVNVLQHAAYAIPNDLNIDLDVECEKISSVTVEVSERPEFNSGFSYNDKVLTLDPGVFSKYKGLMLTVNYYEDEQEQSDAIYSAMNDSESKSFVFNNRLYIIDGVNYLVVDKANNKYTVKEVSDIAYVPTPYRNLGVGDISPEDLSKYEYEQKNLLCDKFKHTYIADGKTTDYPLYDDGDVVEVKVNETKLGSDAYTVENGKIKFDTAPTIPEDKPENYAGVEITFKKKPRTDDKGVTVYSAELDLAKINNCTICATFDKRVFLTGNPDYPNHIWFCGYNNAVGYEDALYFGELDYVIDGVENAPITGLIPVADTLAAIKNHTRQDASVYFHSRMESGEGVIPVTYPAEPGLSGIGCLGACVNFLDDPVFISRLGVEGIEKMAVNLERSISHRSSLIDAKLVNLNLQNARFAEWDGYLVVLVDGKIFLADSRQRYVDQIGVTQYEWYYLENIGIFEGQVPEYYYVPALYDHIPEEITVDGVTYNTSPANDIYNRETLSPESLVYTAVSVDDVVKSVNIDDYSEYFVIKETWDGESYTQGAPNIVKKAILVESRGSYTGGEFYGAKIISNIEDNIFFGTDNGIVCSFNFDMRYEDGTLSPKYYSFDNRTIYCGAATKMDNCAVPHLAKSTIKKSTVIKTKTMGKSVVKVRVRTNSKAFHSIARVNSQIFSFEDVDFSDFSFVASDQTIFAIKEKEKHWVEKQHWIYSDEYQCPLSLHYIAFRYKISGRIKG
jgi:hypothetical protein